MQVWKKYGELKCTLKNIYAPNFYVSSGETEDDAILRASQHHWLWKKNKSVFKLNGHWIALRTIVNTYVFPC